MAESDKTRLKAESLLTGYRVAVLTEGFAAHVRGSSGSDHLVTGTPLDGHVEWECDCPHVARTTDCSHIAACRRIYHPCREVKP
jgi:hypothetical protein